MNATLALFKNKYICANLKKCMTRRLYYFKKGFPLHKMLFSVLAIQLKHSPLRKLSLRLMSFQDRKIVFKKICLAEVDALTVSGNDISSTLFKMKDMQFYLVPRLRIVENFLKHWSISINNAYLKTLKLCKIKSNPRGCMVSDSLGCIFQHRMNVRHSPYLFALLSGCCFSKQNDPDDNENDSLITEKLYVHNIEEAAEERFSQAFNYGTVVDRTNVIPSLLNTGTCVSAQFSEDVSSTNSISKPMKDSDHDVYLDSDLKTLTDFHCQARLIPLSCREENKSKAVKRTLHELSSVKKTKLEKQKENESSSKHLIHKPLISVKNEEQSLSVVKSNRTILDLQNKDLCKSNDGDRVYNISRLFDENSKNVAQCVKERDWKPRIRPNHFVALKISNPEIHKSLEEVQNYIIEQDYRLKPSIIPLSGLHITLMVFHLNNDEEFERAAEILRKAHRILNESMSENPLKLEFEGLGNFNDKVLFAKVKSGDSLNRLIRLSQDVNNWFEDASIFSTDEKREFNSHLTVMKLSRSPQLYRKGIKKIDPSLYFNYKDKSFGSEVIKSIELLKMSGPKDASGYYTGIHYPFDISCEGNLINPSVSKLSPSEKLSKEVEEEKRKITESTRNQLKKLSFREKDSNPASK